MFLMMKPFLFMNFLVKEKMKTIFLALLQTLIVISLIKIRIVFHNQFMKKTWYLVNKSSKILDDVLDLNNYDTLPPQEPITFHYSEAEGQFVMDWTTTKQSISVGTVPNQNVIKYKLGPRR